MDFKYAIIRTHKRVDDKDHPFYPRHPVMWQLIEERVFDNAADALIEKNKLEFPEDFIIIPHL